MISEGEIMQFISDGTPFSTSDIYRALGGNKSKDVRAQLDNLYKQGTIDRNKISNSYFWNLRPESNEINEEADTPPHLLQKTMN